MKHESLFSGIGGFDLAAEWMGWENIFHCEWNPFGQKVLKYYWPKAISYENIKTTDFTIHRGNIDIITGGFPCQPYSSAGKRKGKEDERHLWPEMLRAIKEIQPRWIVGENVYGLVNWSGGLVFHEVQADLEAEGYEVFPYLLPAVSVNAPHRRDRIWFVAHATGNGWNKRRKGIDGRKEHIIQDGNTIRSESATIGEKQSFTDSNNNGCNECDSQHEINTSEGRINAFDDIKQSDEYGDASNSDGIGNKNWYKHQTKQFDENDIERGIVTNSANIRRADALENGELERGQFRKSYQRNAWDSFPSVSPICDGDDGISDRLDNITFSKWRNESIKAGGNAIVPQVVYQIFKTIEQYENTNRRT